MWHVWLYTDLLQALKERTFKLRVLTRWDLNFCVRSSPLRGLQTARRDHNGVLKSTRLKTREQLKADKLRAETVNFIMNHIGDHKGSDGNVLNADQPAGRVRFRTVEERLAAMPNPRALPREPVLHALQVS